MLRVHEESALTGNFRVVGKTLQCQVRCVVKASGHVVETYRSWRKATDADCVLAAVATNGIADHERAIA